MKSTTLGFIGGGRVTKIFLQAFANKKASFEKIIVFDINADVLSLLKSTFPKITVTGDLHEAARQSTVFIALHPPVIMETLDKIAPEITENTLVVSLAPKINLEKMASKLAAKNIVRLIPNATSYINDGYNPVCFSPDVTTENKQAILELLGMLGHTFEVAEPKMEAYAILSAMLPTYFWFQWNELTKIGQQIGLSEEESKASVQQTLEAAINLMFDSGLSPEQVMDLIPVKPIGEHQEQITEIYQAKLLTLFEKIKP